MLAETLAFGATFCFYVFKALAWNEQRRDLAIISDWLLDAVPAVDTSFLIFLIQHVVHAHYAYQVARGAVPIAPTLATWTLLLWTRMFMLSLLPLRAPPNLVRYEDLLEKILLGGGEYQHDCFFSGHVSTLVTMGLTANYYRPYFWAAAAVAAGMVASKVHWSIDLLVAPYVSCCTFWLVQYAYQ